MGELGCWGGRRISYCTCCKRGVAKSSSRVWGSRYGRTLCFEGELFEAGKYKADLYVYWRCTVAQRHTDLWNRHRTRAKVFKTSKADLEMKTTSLVFLHRPFSQSKNGKALLTGSFFWGYFWMQVQMKHGNSGSPQCGKPVENTSFSKPQFVQVGCFVLCHLADMEISIFRPSYFCFFFFLTEIAL